MAVPVEFVADKEPWCQYTLDDGSVIRIRIMLVKCVRDGLNAEGKPQYGLQMQNVCDVTPSDLAVQSATEEQRVKDSYRKAIEDLKK
jgi:hypothetical protein